MLSFGNHFRGANGDEEKRVSEQRTIPVHSSVGSAINYQ